MENKIKVLAFFIACFSNILLASEVQQIKKHLLFEWVANLEFTPNNNPSQNNLLIETKKLITDSLRERKDLNQKEILTLKAHHKKISSFLKIKEEIDNCGPDDIRGLKMGTLIKASQISPCRLLTNANPLNTEQEKNFRTIQNHLDNDMKDEKLNILGNKITKEALRNNLKAQLSINHMFHNLTGDNPDICKNLSNNFPQYKTEITKECHNFKNELKTSKLIPKYKNIDQIKSDFSQRSTKLNKTIKDINHNISCELAEKRDEQGLNALQILKLARNRLNNDPQYINYLQQYDQVTQDNTGRLLLIPPLDKKFGSPIKGKDIQLKAIKSHHKKCSDGRMPIGLHIPIHLSHNYQFSQKQNDIDISQKEIQELVSSIKKSQNKATKKLITSAKENDPIKKIEQIIKYNPLALGKALITNPNNIRYLCPIMAKINKADKRTKNILTVVDYTALTIGVIPFFGVAGKFASKGINVSSKLISSAITASLGRTASIAAMAATSAEMANSYHKLNYYNGISENFNYIILNANNSSEEAKRKYNEAKSNYDKAIMDSFLIGGASTLSSALALKNLVQSKNIEISHITKKLNQMTKNLKNKHIIKNLDTDHEYLVKKLPLSQQIKYQHYPKNSIRPNKGDLTDQELSDIQKVVNETEVPIIVVGSSTIGRRRGLGQNLKIGHGENSKSDIDYVIPSTQREVQDYFKAGPFTQYDDLPQSQLPSFDKLQGLMFQKPDESVYRLWFLPGKKEPILLKPGEKNFEMFEVDLDN